MTPPRWIASPLAGTAAVLAGLGLLAIPLRKLTSERAVPVARNIPAEAPSTEAHAVLRLKLLAPAKRLTVKTAEGNILLELPAAPAGESEHDVALALAGEAAELSLEAEMGEAETAVFLTLMPDGREDRTRYAIGSGRISETLRFDWSAP